MDLENDAFPFADKSVDCIYSSHCFEHLTTLKNVWREVSRVIKTNGTIEIWTPYPHSDDQWLKGHVSGWSFSRWDHLSSSERSFIQRNFLMEDIEMMKPNLLINLKLLSSWMK